MAWAICTQRSPNLPAAQMIALSPAEKRFETAASIAPVPDEANSAMPLSVAMK